jgi:HK97 family phage prohead protease
MRIDPQVAAQARAARIRSANDRPTLRRCAESRESGSAVVRASLRLESITRAKGAEDDLVRIVGYASTTETPYEMYDAFGPYTEVVTRGAFELTLARSPMVEFTVNHGAGGGLPMAHTRNGTLDISEDETGLRYAATVDPSRSDVADLLKALERGDVAESSFKFVIDRGLWSPDWTEYRIDQADLDRGDVSAVNFGANPTTTSGLERAETAAPAVTRTRISAMPGELEFRSAI